MQICTLTQKHNLVFMQIVICEHNIQAEVVMLLWGQSPNFDILNERHYVSNYRASSVLSYDQLHEFEIFDIYNNIILYFKIFILKLWDK